MQGMRSCSSHGRGKGKVKIIDLLRARLDARADAYKAELPSLQLNDIHIRTRSLTNTIGCSPAGFMLRSPSNTSRPSPGSRAVSHSELNPSGRYRCPHMTHSIRLFRGDHVSHSTSGGTCCSEASALSPRGSPAAAGHADRSHGSVRGTQLQRGRARTAWYWQIPSLSADLAVLSPCLRRQGHSCEHVRQQRHREARTRRAVRRHLFRRSVGRFVRHKRGRKYSQGLYGVW